MKELLSKYVARKEEFQDMERSVEREFSEFIQGIPGWREKLECIIVVHGYKWVSGEDFIPKFKNINLLSDGRISFSVRILSDTWVPKYVDVGPFPFEYLTSPETIPYPQEYIREKIIRRQGGIDRVEREIKGLEKEKSDLEKEISKLQGILGRKES